MQKVVSTCSSSELSHGLDKRCTLNVTDSATQLDDAYIWLLIRVVDWDSCNTFYPVLNRVCQMWNDLHRLTKIIASSLAFDHMLVNLACCDIVLPCQRDVEVSFVISEVKIDFTTVI